MQADATSRVRIARRLLTFILAALVLTATGPRRALASSLLETPNPRTRDHTWVTDVPGMLQPHTVGLLNETITALERDTGVEIAVAIVRSLDDTPVEDAAVELFQAWGIGKRNQDNGALFLWAVEDRKVRIEVGYGLEGSLPDGKVGAILDQYVTPRFREERWDEGVLNGLLAVAAVIRNEPVTLASEATDSYDPAPAGSFAARSERSAGRSVPIVTLVLGALALLFGGLGSIFGVRRWRRYRGRACPVCGTKMARLGEVEDDSHLEPAKQAEERIGSVNYDVWKCSFCAHHFVLRYPRWFTRFKKCPQCSNRTSSSREKTLTAATTASTGLAHVTETCEFCNYRREYNKTLPRLSSSSSSSSSSGRSGGSFGGGRSGGGGASRGY